MAENASSWSPGGHGLGDARRQAVEAVDPGPEALPTNCGNSHGRYGDMDYNREPSNRRRGGKFGVSIRGPAEGGRALQTKRGTSRSMVSSFSFHQSSGLSPGQIQDYLQDGLSSVVASQEARQMFINGMATENGLAIVRQIVETDFSPTYSVLIPMFDPHCILFLQLITDEGILSSLLLEKSVGTIYNVVYGHDGNRGVAFFTKVANCLLRMREEMETGNTNCVQFGTALMVATQALLSTLTLNQGAAIKLEFREVVKNFCNSYILDENDASPASHGICTAHEHIAKIKDILSIGDSIALSRSTVKAHVDATRQKRRLPQHVVDLPGELSQHGPRHDNDHAFISEIKILPTTSEIMSDERPEFLPAWNCADSSSFHHETGILRLLDSQFRLLREDTSGSIRDGIRLIIEEWDALVHNPDWRLKRKILRERSPTPIRIYSGVEVKQMKSDPIKGVEMDIEFDQLHRLQNMNEQRRKEWWRESRALKEGGAVLALIDGEDEGDVNVIFLLVSQRKTSISGQHDEQNSKVGQVCDVVSSATRAMITVRPASLKYEVNLPNLISLVSRGKSPRPLVLVEFPAVVYNSFEGVLRCLQSLHQNPTCIPFTTWLAPRDQGTTLIDSRAPTYTDGTIVVPPPAYLSHQTALDLSCIPACQENGESATSTLTMSLSEDSYVLSTKLAEQTTLDPGQAFAMVSALKHEIALIQGPPGTGKSYVGIQIARCLLHNRDLLELGPIVCVCYTNHALDQFLHELLDAGVTEIIRMGSRSTSPRLEAFSLDNYKRLSPKPRIRGLKKSMRDCKAYLEALGAQIEEVCQHAQESDISMVARFLKKRFPAQSDSIFGGGAEHEMMADWMSGDAPGDWKAGDIERSIDHLLLVDIWTLTNPERHAVFSYWKNSAFTELSQKFQALLEEHCSAKQQYTSLFNASDVQILERSHVIGVNTAGLANNADLLRGLRAKVLICEEAGEVLESHVLTALLPSVQHAILIGDHLQLRPRISNHKLSMQYDHAGPIYNLDESLFERLANARFGDQNLPGGGTETRAGCRFPIAQLDHQRRMHPSISTLIRETLYPRLYDDSETASYPGIAGMKRRLFWLDHRNTEDPSDPAEPMQSKTNMWEAKMVTALVRHLCRQGKYKPGEIAVLTPYVAQLRALQRMLEQDVELVIGEQDMESIEDSELGFEEENGSWDNARFSQERQARLVVEKGKLSNRLRMATVDNFQGEEATVVIVSLVRSNRFRNCGFLKTPNRINVLLSRARHGMYIIGDASTACTAPMWSSVIQLLEKNANIGQKLELHCARHPNNRVSVSSPDDFSIHAPEGGCSEKCGLRLDCGHTCVVKCHSTTLHKAVKCRQMCTKTRDCGHVCSNKCSEPCGECHEQVFNVQLACGHTAKEMECRHMRNLASVKCNQSIIRQIPGCGHQITTRCHENASFIPCDRLCDQPLPCGHNCQKECRSCRGIKKGLFYMRHGLCTTRCGRKFTTCSHSCNQACHPGTPCPPCSNPCEVRCRHSQCPRTCSESCSPCAEQCGWSCDHRSDRCNMPCAVPCDIFPCNRRCEKKLEGCGHQCPGVCGEVCPDSTFCQICCSPDILERDVDFILFDKYGVINVDENPMIFLSCGHFYTISCLDSIMELDQHYLFDPATGNITGPKRAHRIVTPTSTSKGCPECRMPLRNIDRYNRVVKNAVLDEATRRFVKQAGSGCVTLADDIHERELKIEEERQQFTLEWSQEAGESRTLDEVKASAELYQAKGIDLQRQIHKFIKSVAKTEQPFGRVNGLYAAAVARQRDVTPNVFEFDESIIQTGFQLRGQSLSLGLSWATLWDLNTICNNITVDSRMRSRLSGVIGNRCLGLLAKCFTLRKSSHDGNFMQQEVEARIYHALFSMLWLSNRQSQGVALDDATASSTRQTERESLQECETLCLQYPTTLAYLNDSLGKAKLLVSEGTFYGSVTTEEKREVYRAMAQQFSGTGHWYYCQNNHPFTVGECGMPMEQARCPQCDAPIGGLNHSLAQGVSRAYDFETEFGGA